MLGYIFEKYVNQKQMGAYYTKEDITGYISRNTVIPLSCSTRHARNAPWLLDRTVVSGGLLRDEADCYIYPAVGHGIAWNARQTEAPVHIDAPYDLPEDIAAGISDLSKRGGWNAPAQRNDCALPTETWREVVARRSKIRRCPEPSSPIRRGDRRSTTSSR